MSGTYLAIPGDIVIIERRDSGTQFPAAVVRVGKDGRPVCCWISSTHSRSWLSTARTLQKDKQTLVRKAAPFEADDFRRRVALIVPVSTQ